ncbi:MULTISPECIES: hypothetical protein [unclassified Streptomyces]|uniref:hypothetical protein n=1 Tax=unclassified Streptomyces TaxID=2593676 RepID=UPI00115FF3FB|nr:MULTISPECIES: hypothetical protein [unclassified Streptomyces]
MNVLAQADPLDGLKDHRLLQTDLARKKLQNVGIDPSYGIDVGGDVEERPLASPRLPGPQSRSTLRAPTPAVTGCSWRIGASIRGLSASVADGAGLSLGTSSACWKRLPSSLLISDEHRAK